MGTPTNPEVGDRVFDGSEFTYLKDLSPKELQGMLTAQPNLAIVLQEILTNQAAWGGQAGVTPDDVAEIATITERIGRIDQFLKPAAKFVEMLEETRYLLEDRRQHKVFDIGAAAERRGKEIPELLARYEQTRAYRSAAGKKAAKTRKKNAEAQEVEATAGEAQAEPTPAPQAP